MCTVVVNVSNVRFTKKHVFCDVLFKEKGMFFGADKMATCTVYRGRYWPWGNWRYAADGREIGGAWEQRDIDDRYDAFMACRELAGTRKVK
jgi:hypothetical protein